MKFRVSMVVIAAAVSAAFFASVADAELADSYCSPTGDYCTAVVDKGGPIKLKIATFSFTGPYTICVDPPAGHEDCDRFNLGGSGDLHRDSVSLGSHFPHRASGRYSVKWQLDGHTLGKTLHFNRR